jgi:tetratricopeptide (TPR) repeat protein
MTDAKILRIVVASPGDVQKERDLVPKVVEEVNRDIAKDKGLRLEVYRWETDAYPGFHLDGAQGLIDPILKIEDCDILIGIFWKRFGKPVKDAKSGTEHEFNTAYEAWKKKSTPQIMVYFSQKKYMPQSEEETEQQRLVIRFKKDFPEEGLWWSYQNPAAFEHLLRGHLINFLQNRKPTSGKPEEPEIPVPQLLPLHQLPPPPADFTGRENELNELRAAIETSGAHISGLQGQGGVGKTALAVKLAHEIASKFPDAQIFLNLRGVSTEPSDKPLTTAEAMAHVIRSFHPESKLPESEPELSGHYQNVLHGKRVLLLMDNARDAAQVKPLIPPQGCALLVTSRQYFTLQGLHPERLDTLPPPKAEAFLLAVAPRIQEQAKSIAKLCAYLPLALELAARTLADRVDLDPADYAQRLASEENRPKLLAAGNESVESSISLSYALLDPEIQKRWRMLGVFPDTFDELAAAAVWGMEGTASEDAITKALNSAKDTLSQLLQYSMLEWNEATKRYRLHDLTRDFARIKMSGAERDEAAFRHSEHYKNVLAFADLLYLKGGGSVLRGLALFDLEWGNTQAGQAWASSRAATDDEAARVASNYAHAGVYCLDLRQHPRERIVWRDAALSAARRLKDRQSEGVHLSNLGSAFTHLGETSRAIDYYEKALAVARRFGDRRGEGNVLGNLGSAYADLGETRRAIESYEQRLKIALEIGDRVGEGNALGSLGSAYRNLGKTRRAIEFYEQRLKIARDIGDRRGEGTALGNLGNAFADLGETRRAIEFYEQAQAIDIEVGDRRGEAADLFNMSLALDQLGERKQAIEHAEAALKIYGQIEDPNAAQVRRQLDDWKSEPRPKGSGS